MTFGVWAMFLSIADYCWRERAAVVRFGGVTFLVVAVVSFLTPMPTKDSGASVWTMAALMALAQSICYLPVTVAWYRKVVLGDGGVTGRPAFTLGRREGRLFLWQGAIMAISLALLAIAAAIVAGLYLSFAWVSQIMAFVVCAIAIVVLFLVWFAALNRMGMILVLVATDQPVSLGAAWALTRGITWPLLGTLSLLVLAGILGGIVAEMIALPFSGVFALWVKAVAGAAVGLVTLIATATLFGFAYLRVMQARGALTDSAAS